MFHGIQILEKRILISSHTVFNLALILSLYIMTLNGFRDFRQLQTNACKSIRQKNKKTHTNKDVDVD